MINLSFWNKTEGFKLADGTPCTVQEVYERYSFTRDGAIVLEFLANGNVGGIDAIEILREVHQIDPVLDDNAALARIIEIRNTPPVPTVDATAAKIDYLIMMTE